jgi:hypothetical protein
MLPLKLTELESPLSVHVPVPFLTSDELSVNFPENVYESFPA